MTAPAPDGGFHGDRQKYRFLSALALVERAKEKLHREEELSAKMDMRTQFIDGASGAGRPHTAGGSSVLRVPPASPFLPSKGSLSCSLSRRYDASPRGAERSRSRFSTSLNRNEFGASRVLHARQDLRRKINEHPRARHPALTTRIVPHRGDYSDAYCNACEFEDQQRCTFCHMSKLSIFRRMPLVRLARELLLLKPHMTATHLSREISKYATSDEAANAVNEKMDGWWTSPANPAYALCMKHAGAKDEFDEVEKNYRDEIARLSVRVEASEVAYKREAGEVARLQKVLYHEHLDEDELRMKIRLLEREMDQLRIALADGDARAKAAEVEIKELKHFDVHVESCATQTDAKRREPHASCQTDWRAPPASKVQFKVMWFPFGGGGGRRAASPPDVLKVHDTFHGAPEEEDIHEGPAEPAPATATQVTYGAPDEPPVFETVYAGNDGGDREGSDRDDEASDHEDNDSNDDSTVASSASALKVKKRVKKRKRVRYHNARYGKLNTIKPRSTQSLQTLLLSIYAVYESKVGGDRQDVDAGHKTDPLEVDVRDYWRQTLGLKKMAAAKAKEMVAAAKALMGKSRRVFVFAWLLGLDVSRHMSAFAPEDAGRDLLFSPQLSRAYFTIFFAIMNAHKAAHSSGSQDKGIKEYLTQRPEGEGGALVTRREFLSALMGPNFALPVRGSCDAPALSSTLSLDEVRKKKLAFISSHGDPAHCDDLCKLLSPKEVRAFVLDVADLPRVAPHAGDVRHTVSSVDTVDLDDAMFLLVRHGSRALARHCGKLTSLFHRFDIDKPGLTKVEFRSFCLFALGEDAQTGKESDKIHFQIEDICDGDEDPQDDDELIDNAPNFALATLQIDCKLAYSADCRDHWTRGGSVATRGGAAAAAPAPGGAPEEERDFNTHFTARRADAAVKLQAVHRGKSTRKHAQIIKARRASGGPVARVKATPKSNRRATTGETSDYDSSRPPSSSGASRPSSRSGGARPPLEL